MNTAAEKLESGNIPNQSLAQGFWIWVGVASSYPIEKNLVLDFIHSHREGPHRFSTVYQRMVALSAIHRRGGYWSLLEDGDVQASLSDCRRQLAKVGLGPAPLEPITGEVLRWMLAVMPKDTPRGIRDRAIVTLGFFSGGRRVSELVGALREHIVYSDKGFHFRIPVSKADRTAKGMTVPVYGKAYTAMRAWLRILAEMELEDGPLFLPIDRWGNVLAGPMSKKSVRRMIRHYLAVAGLDPARYGCHSLRSGFVTEAFRLGCRARDIMQLTGHRDERSLQPYARFGELEENPAARLKI